MITFLVAAALAGTPCCSHTLDRNEAAVVAQWIKQQGHVRLAVDADSKCADDIEALRHGTPGTPRAPVPDFHPYQVAADFNRDGERDVAVALRHDNGNFGLVVFNGPLAIGVKPAFREGLGTALACGGLFIGPPRPEPDRLRVGPFESDNPLVLVPDGAGYKLRFGEVDEEAIAAKQTFQGLPAAVRERLLALFAGEVPADPGAEYQTTDLVLDANLPHRRIGFWTQRKSTYFIYYEHGGYGWHSHLVGISYRGEQARPEVNLRFFGRFASLEQLLMDLPSLEFDTPGIEGDARSKEF